MLPCICNLSIFSFKGILLDFLSLNPCIKIPASEEIHFFDIEENFAAGLSYYKYRLPTALPNQIIIEKTSNYFDVSVVPERIYRMNNSIKLILILCDPVERLISEYVHQQHWGRLKSVTFKSFVFDQDGHVLKSSEAIVEGMYNWHMTNWHKFFSKDQILVLDGYTFLQDPVFILNKVEDFLRVPRFISYKNIAFSKKKNFFCKLIQGATSCASSHKGLKHPNVDINILEKLYHFYKPFNILFTNMMKKNFSWTNADVFKINHI